MASLASTRPRLPTAVARRNAFRYDDADAEVPQHNWRQGPDYRGDRVEGAGYAAVGSNRPKQLHGGDAPTARVARSGGADEEIAPSGFALDRKPTSQSQRKKGAAGPGHESGIGGRPRKLARQQKKSGVRQGYGRW